MPHYSWEEAFMREFRRLTRHQQMAFLHAVQRDIVEPLRNGQQPDLTIFHRLSNHPQFEYRWDRSGHLRATCDMFTNDQGQVEIHWRHIGDHHIYTTP